MLTEAFSGASNCSAIVLRTFFALGARIELPLLNVTPSSFTFSSIFLTGQPFDSTEPESNGQRSSPLQTLANLLGNFFCVTQGSQTPSLSVSGSSKGQPKLSAEPASKGHLSTPSQTPTKNFCKPFSDTQEAQTLSLSRSGQSTGQPTLAAEVASKGHLSAPLHTDANS